MPSDNMNMVMTHEFGNDFVRKMLERHSIEAELNKIATIQAKNAKHNIYVTKSQALRDQLTMHTLNKRAAEEQENAYYQSLAKPKLTPVRSVS